MSNNLKTIKEESIYFRFEDGETNIVYAMHDIKRNKFYIYFRSENDNYNKSTYMGVVSSLEEAKKVVDDMVSDD